MASRTLPGAAVAAEAHPPPAGQAPGGIAAVGSVARALVGAGALGELAEHALGAMCESLGLRVAALYLPDADGVPLLRRFAAAGGDVGSVGLLDELRFEHEAWRLASAGGRALVFHEPATWLVANPFDPPASAWIVLPLDSGDEVVGVVAAAQRHPFALDEAGATVLAILGDLLGAGIAAARLRQQIARTEVERERLRLAADMHDGLAQDLALAKREIALLDSGPPADQAAESRARLREAIGAAHRIVRARLEDLSIRVPVGGLADAVRAACDRARERGLDVELRCAAAVEPAAPETSAVVLRVLGEALANVERHAHATRAVVDLRCDERALTLTVSDDGRGLGEAADHGPVDGHFGIALMRERAASLGGSLELGAADGGGTFVRLEVPRA
jgi:signal transduction histidine kinase